MHPKRSKSSPSQEYPSCPKVGVGVGGLLPIRRRSEVVQDAVGHLPRDVNRAHHRIGSQAPIGIQYAWAPSRASTGILCGVDSDRAVRNICAKWSKNDIEVSVQAPGLHVERVGAAVKEELVLKGDQSGSLRRRREAGLQCRGELAGICEGGRSQREGGYPPAARVSARAPTLTAAASRRERGHFGDRNRTTRERNKRLSRSPILEG